MNTSQLETCTHSVRQIVEATAAFIRQQIGQVSGSQIETKSLNSLVSYVDKQAEEQLVAGLSRLLPGSVFLTEEATVEQIEGEWQWIIDPLDGTTNFLHGLPYFAVSVALRQHYELVLGVVYEVTRQECFYAWKGGGAWLNGQRIRVATPPALSEALIATGFPYRDFELMERYFEAMRRLMRESRGLRRYGAAAVDLAYVACGRFDAFFEYGLSAWDVAAGLVLVAEAGGVSSDFHGGTDYLFGGELLAATPSVFPELQAVISDSFARKL